jgi:hypothetical protein
VNVSSAALAAQFRLQQRMVAGLTASYEGVNYVQQLRAALTARGEQSIGRSDAAQIAAATQSLDSALASLVTTGFGVVHRDLGRRYSDQFIADAMPTPSVIAGVDEPCKQLDAAIASLQRLATTSIAALNAQLARPGTRAPGVDAANVVARRCWTDHGLPRHHRRPRQHPSAFLIAQ